MILASEPFAVFSQREECQGGPVTSAGRLDAPRSCQAAPDSVNACFLGITSRGPQIATSSSRNAIGSSSARTIGRLWYETPDNAIGYAMHSSRSDDAVIRVYDDAGNRIEMHKHRGDFKEW